MKFDMLNFIQSCIVIVLILFTSESSHVSGQGSRERTATLAFLREFAREFPQLRQIWTGDDYCAWSGVSCDPVTSNVKVDLSHRNLFGEMPELPDHINGRDVLVTYMNLSHNINLYDEFEEDWRELSRLEVLDLSYTSLIGSIPDKWNDMKSLQEVYISHTKACKRLPHWRIKSLRVIDLSYNNMGGRLSSSWAEMTSLQQVRLEGNHFCGCAPHEWRGNSLLMAATPAINLHPQCEDNKCNKESDSCDDRHNSTSTSSSTSSIPPTPSSSSSSSSTTPTPDVTPRERTATLAFLRGFAREFPQLRQIWTGDDYCTWSGVSCDPATSNVKVDLSHRNLFGEMPELPDHINGRDVLVTYMNLSHNINLYDEFEEDWRELSRLEVLDLSYTSLIGSIPDKWNDMKSLQEVYISHTKACKRLPHWRIKSLRVIDLSYNNMGGRLSSSWAEMTSLQQVRLEGNYFCGCAPHEWRSNSLLMAATPASNLHPQCWQNECSVKS